MASRFCATTNRFRVMETDIVQDYPAILSSHFSQLFKQFSSVRKSQKCMALNAPGRRNSCKKPSSLMPAQTDMFCPREFATSMLARSPLLALPYLRRRCRLKPHSSTHTIFLLPGGASPRKLTAYCFRASTVDGQFLETGIARGNLIVKPILFNAFDKVALQTDIRSSSDSLRAKYCSVASGRSSIQADNAVRPTGPIFGQF